MLTDRFWRTGVNWKLKPRGSFTLLLVGALAFSLGCGAKLASVRPNRAPTPNFGALDEAELLCQPDERGCRPTKIWVEVCETEFVEGCTTRDEIYRFLQIMDTYEDYIRALRGEKPEPEVTP